MLAIKNPKQVQAEDFLLQWHHHHGKTHQTLSGSRVTPVFATSSWAKHFGISCKVLQKGDVFVFPVGLVHFQRNLGHGNAVVIAALSSQNPGAITIANTVFGANPPIPSDILAKAFQVDSSLALAYEPAPIQDFCVSDPNSSVKLNGVACKNPMQVQAEDFFFSGLHLRGNTSNAVGLVHYQRNVGNGNAVVIAALSSQNPGAITIANAVFGANPSIPSDILARAFQVDKSVVDQLQAKF
ncbi:putative germin-like protein 2-1 [Tanacetum coccineum]